MKNMNKKEEALEWAKQFETSKRWLTHIQTNKTGSHKTQLEYAYRLKRFCDWANKTPDQLIAEREEQLKGKTKQGREKTEDLVSDFFQFQSKPHEGETEKENHRMSAKAYYGALRSFYKCNSDVGLKGDTPRAVGRRVRGITLDEFKQIDTIVNPRDRALLRFMKDSGCSTEDVVVFNYGDIKKEFEEGKDFIHLQAVRQKTQTNYDTFIGRNAVEALKTYFQIRKQHGEVFNDKTPLFLSNLTRGGRRARLNENSLRTVFSRIKQKIGIVVSPHRIRKMFSTCMAMKIHHPIVLKYWMGHSVGGSGDVEGSYVLPDLKEQLQAYMEAYNCIDINPKTDEKEMQIQNLINSAIAMGLSSEKIEDIRKVVKREKRMTPEEVAQMIKKELTPGGNCANGQHCQRIVNEEELSKLLADGWAFVATLPSGKIVVSNET
jgi:integrase